MATKKETVAYDDLDALQVIEGPQTFRPINPLTGKKMEIVLEVVSSDDPDFKKTKLKQLRANAAKGEKLTPEDVVDNERELIASLIVGWSNIQIKGKEFKYSKANALELVSKWPWIGEQVDRFCGNLAHFLIGSEKA